MERLSAYPIWYADYEPLPQTPYHFTFWQYSNTGSVEGISGDVDFKHTDDPKVRDESKEEITMPDIKILVVDDEKEIADLIEIYLVSDGYKVFKAENAVKGLEILEKRGYSSGAFGYYDAGMNGLDMCKKIRETNNIHHYHAPAPSLRIWIRSWDWEPGPTINVVKPFNPLELTARVKSQLRRYTQLNPNSAGPR